MKKILYLILLLSAVKLQAQQTATFKISYLPNHTYAGAINLKAVCNVNLSGNDTIIAKITAKGIPLPLNANLNLKMDMSTKTGPANADQSVPASMKISFDDLGVVLNGNKLPIPLEKLGQGITVAGRFDKDGVFQSDSVQDKGNDAISQKLKKMTDGFQKKIKFPDHPMKVGESFTQGLPFNMPITDSKLKIDAKTVYTLTSIADGFAYFDLKPSLDISIPIKGNTLTITGGGSGKMVYSLKDNFATDYSTTFNLVISGLIEKVQIDAKANFEMSYKYTITAN
jgi:hypothetical protein